MILALGSTLLGSPALAEPVSEVTVKWASGTPETLTTGQVLNTEVRINLNDDQPAPDDTVNENFTANFTVANAEFTQIPESCLVEGVTPQSAISDDGTELTCNFGEQVEGTALALQVPLQVKGSTGDTVTFDARVGDVNADQLVANIENPFMMDIDWTNPTALAQSPGNQRAVQFEWTLYWGEGSDPGPDSVSYNLNAVPSAGSVTSIGNCGPFVDAFPSGHPNSGITDPADQVAPFPECNITGTGANATMTLSGLDYSKTQVPSKDSGGNALPADRVAIASGKIIVNVTAANPGNVVLTSSAPEYQAPSGGVANDDPSNNRVNKTWLNPGGWASNWQRPYTNSGGQPLDDTYRVSQGTEVLSVSYFAEAVTQSNRPANTSLILCHILDNKYTEFTGATTVVHPSAEPIPGATIQYFVGAVPGLNPNQTNYNPGAVSCGDLAGSNPGAGTGWLTTEPANKSTIKAVRAVMTRGHLQGHPRALLEVTQTIKPSTPVGTDVWQFSHHFQGGTGWAPAVLPNNAGNTVAQPARYPTTNAHRDLLRVVGLTPNIRKSVDNPSLRVGEEAEFTLAYSANGGTSAPETVDDFVIVDKLPAGLTYVEGSATVDPTVTEENGAQVLTWNLDGVQTNETQELTYRATANEKAAPGERLVNSANATVQGRTSGASVASVTISQDGRTIIGKSADQNFIPNVDGNGSGEGSWTVSLRSDDPFPQSFTDLIDILPYNGDERGTDFSGNYSVEDVVLSDGGTVYYTTASVNDLSDDPADASNGAAGNIDGNTVGWTDTKPADASSITAIRVIAGELLPSAERSFQVKISTDGAKGGDTYVNRVQGRASHTELVMRISAPTIVSQYYAYDLKKYVMNSAGEWVDAQDENEAEWPQLAPTDTAKYKFVVTNTGQGDLTNIVVSDPLFGDDPVWTIDELASGDSVESEEFEFDLSGTDSEVLRNEACAVTELPADSSQEELINPCDEANVFVLPKLNVEKTSNANADVKPGDTVSYTVTATNDGPGTYTETAPAVITDDMTDVLDDAVYQDDAVATVDGVAAGSINFENPRLVWNGPLAPGESVTIIYTVKLGASGDGNVRNVAFLGDGETPECTTDEQAARICGEVEYPLELPGLHWQKVGDDAAATPLAGSEWSLVPLDEDGAQISDKAITVLDCVADTEADCADQTDQNPAEGGFLVKPLKAGDYQLVETKAPAGFKLLTDPMNVTISVDNLNADGDLDLGDIVNEKQNVPAIPLTGGVGTFSILLTAGGIMLAAAVLLIVRARRLRLTEADGVDLLN
ncbi:fimbrial isopeptide formation D2 family protein [Leucobacter exalbidus]|uniref:Fimbrial isopeptide formation D2 family protein n=1 Tax=Leucobacter exalbidus TaxID=662960 RepID=A0A940PQS5_9MICO|nr:isopeptide-forming domain-containing fimbrial protein [Leucobacter exalbidus]MBP1325033.1 fimbrial isopeptide formation D2 family protein [Leucobacter exalbidus]